MGQKVHPTGYRIGITTSWRSRWFSQRNSFRKQLQEDVRIREYIKKKLADARVEKVEIERSGKSPEVVVTVYTAKPGMVIGRGGTGIEDLKCSVEKDITKHQTRVKINIQEIRQSALCAEVVGQNIASDIERRIPFRRAARQSLDQVQKAGAKGVKIRLGGRLNGADIARSEKFAWGSIPLHTLRADIDYAHVQAHTTYGVIGIAVWIYKGEVLDEEDRERTAGSEDVLKQIKKITSSKKNG